MPKLIFYYFSISYYKNTNHFPILFMQYKTISVLLSFQAPLFWCMTFIIVFSIDSFHLDADINTVKLLLPLFISFQFKVLYHF